MTLAARHVTTASVSNGTAQDPQTQAALRDWQAVRADDSIQYAPLSPPKPEKPPEWLVALQKWLTEHLGPAGRWLTEHWAVVKWTVLGLAGLALLVLLWRLLAPAIVNRPARAEADEWTPDEQAALALLEDADALAALGRFDEATRLLLQRSVGQIREARPGWLEPASTAREIATMAPLPEAARRAFGIIAERVERSLFALRHLDASDWQAARAAYADFALAGLGKTAG